VAARSVDTATSETQVVTEASGAQHHVLKRQISALGATGENDARLWLSLPFPSQISSIAIRIADDERYARHNGGEGGSCGEDRGRQRYRHEES
jgi:hypothetical protein